MRSARNIRGAMLLEVVLSMAIVVAALGLMSAQLTTGLSMTTYAEEQTRINEVSDRLLALLELDVTMAEQIFKERQIEGDFGTEYPGYYWRAHVDPTDVDGLGAVTLELRYLDPGSRGSGFEDARPVRDLHMLRANPGRINLAEDFGVEEEQLAQFAQQVPIPGFDPAALDPQALVSLDPTTLLALLPQLLQMLQAAGVGGIDPGQPLNPADLASLIEQRVGEGQDGDKATDGASPPDGDRPIETVEDLQRVLTGRPGAQGGGGGGGRSGRTGTQANPPGGGKDRAAGGGSPPGRAGGATIDDLIRMRDQGSAGGAGPRTGGGRSGAQTGQPGSRSGGNTPPGGSRGGAGARSGAGGQQPAGARSSSGQQPGGEGQPRFTIDDLRRMRDENNRRGGG